MEIDEHRALPKSNENGSAYRNDYIASKMDRNCAHRWSENFMRAIHTCLSFSLQGSEPTGEKYLSIGGPGETKLELLSAQPIGDLSHL
jgi:hypothetical protein